MIIIGAGLSGLIAAHAFPNSTVIERDPMRANHRALLRFRTDSISRVTNIPFRRVIVRKGIFDSESSTFIEPNIAVANEYSQKVIGKILDRSIWDMSTAAERFVAPENFYELLVSALGSRVYFCQDYPLTDPQIEPTISTVPLSQHKSKFPEYDENFQRAAITVHRFRISDCDIFQTIYYPNRHFPISRASITGNLLICEGYQKETADLQWIETVLDSFGIDNMSIKLLDIGHQKFGKISPISETIRRRMIIELTNRYRIFSLGRFATWRNILLDDLVKDIDIIKQLMESDEYDGKLITSRTISSDAATRSNSSQSSNGGHGTRAV
jgi:hypothetical protein